MSRRNAKHEEGGFTIIELTVVMVLIGLIIIPIFSFFNTGIGQYFSLQKEGTEFTDLAQQSQRIANVMRGMTDITQATVDEITCYAYFAPSDTYVSLIHYYKTNGNTILKADVTHMTANPPNGTLIPSSAKTFTIIPDFYQASGVKTFTYLDASGNALAMPISDLTTIKGITINLAVPGGTVTTNSNQRMTLTVALRNRKTNL